MTESLEVVEREGMSSSGIERPQLVEHVLATLESDPAFQAEWLLEGGRRYKEIFRWLHPQFLGISRSRSLVLFYRMKFS